MPVSDILTPPAKVIVRADGFIARKIHGATPAEDRPTLAIDRVLEGRNADDTWDGRPRQRLPSASIPINGDLLAASVTLAGGKTVTGAEMMEAIGLLCDDLKMTGILPAQEPTP